MEGTLRTFDEEVRATLHSRIADIAAAIDAQHDVATDIDIDRGYPPVVNDPQLTDDAAAEARACGLRVEMLPLRTTAEDFGYYTLRYPSLFYRLGVGAAAGRSHTGSFAPDERAIAPGIELMRRLALRFLKNR